jgi:hypothetical protein
VPRNAGDARRRVRDIGRNVDPLLRGSYARQRWRLRDRFGTRPGESRGSEAQSSEAGLAAYAEIREGDARQTLRDLGGSLDFALIDGWPGDEGPSLAREVIGIVAPQLRVGGYVMNDNAEPDFLEFIRDPGNGFISVTLPLKNGTELSVKVA